MGQRNTGQFLDSIFIRLEKLDNPSENADMSNEKEIQNCSPKAYGIGLNLRPLSISG